MENISTAPATEMVIPEPLTIPPSTDVVPISDMPQDIPMFDTSMGASTAHTDFSPDMMGTMPTEFIGGMVIFFLIFLTATLLSWIMIVMAQCFMYKKANKAWWAVLVPIYNYIVLLQIVKRPWWWIFLSLLPVVFGFGNFLSIPEIIWSTFTFFAGVVGVTFSVLVVHRLAKSFGKGKWFTAGLVFLPFIFYPILAWGELKYKELKK